MPICAEHDFSAFRPSQPVQMNQLVSYPLVSIHLRYYITFYVLIAPNGSLDTGNDNGCITHKQVLHSVLYNKDINRTEINYFALYIGSSQKEKPMLTPSQTVHYIVGILFISFKSALCISLI